MNALARDPLFEDGDLDRAVAEDRRDGTLIVPKCDAILEASLEDMARYVFNPETAHAVRLQYLGFIKALRQERSPNQPTMAGAGAAFAVQIILPAGAAAPGMPQVVNVQGQVATPQAPIIEIPFASDDPLGDAPPHVQAAALRLAPETANAELHAG